MDETLLLSLVGIIVLGAAAQWLAWRLGLPSILLLLTFGIVAGPVAGWIKPDELFGKELVLAVVSISVALILYEGGLSLRISEFRKVGAVVRNLVTVGAAVTWGITTVAARLIFDFDFGLSALLGAVLVVTGPTVIGPMLRQIRPSGSIGPILKWEGIVIDPIGALLAVLIFEAIQIGNAAEASRQTAIAVAKTIALGGGIGAVAAGALILVIHRYWVADFLQNAVSLMLVVIAFVASNHFQHESGLLAVTVMGFILANQKRVPIEHIVEFKENLRVLLISGLFIVLAARLELDQLTALLGRGLLFVLVLVVVARPLCVLASTGGSALTNAQRWFLAWMAPRGIVAAAVASVFALRMQANGHEAAGQLVPITFITIIATVALYGLTSSLVGRRLGVAEAHPQGILFAGAGELFRNIAKLLQDSGYRVLLVDSNRGHVAEARMAGLPTYAGSVLSTQTLDELDLGGVGRLFAVTPNDWVNVLAVQHFDGIFGRANCYQLPSVRSADARDDEHEHLGGRLLFGMENNYGALAERHRAGFRPKATRISEEFNYDDYREQHKRAVPLFVINAKGRIDIVTADEPAAPQAGDTLISLVPGDAE